MAGLITGSCRGVPPLSILSAIPGVPDSQYASSIDPCGWERSHEKLSAPDQAVTVRSRVIDFPSTVGARPPAGRPTAPPPPGEPVDCRRTTQTA